MKIKLSKKEVLNPVEIIEKLGLIWGDQYKDMVVTSYTGTLEIECPDDIADDVRELLEPYQARESFKLSQLAGLTQEQLKAYIENNVTTLANAKEYLKKLSSVVLYLVRHTQLDR